MGLHLLYCVLLTLCVKLALVIYKRSKNAMFNMSFPTSPNQFREIYRNAVSPC